MIISPGRRYIFVHIPKTGGTSMALALEDRAMKDDILIGDTPKAQRRRGRLKKLSSRGRLWKHARLADIDGVVSAEDLRGMLVFTLVRNPWDRMVSYYHWLRGQGFDHPAVSLAGALPFQAFLAHPTTQAAARNDSAVAYVSAAQGAPQHTHFVRLEHLTADLAPVEAHLGFSLAGLPHVNQSDRMPGYRALYDDRTRDIVGALYADDIARFGYRF